MLPLVIGALCLLVAGLRTFAPSSILSNPLVFVAALMIGLGLAWVGWSARRKARLTQAQFRWRQARYCGRCDAVYVTGEPLYTSPRHVEAILWNTPSQFA